MRTYLSSALLLFMFFLAGTPSAQSGIITLDFEGLAELTEVSSSYAGLGVTFTGATVLTAFPYGISLNEIEHPPQSGYSSVGNVDPVTFASTIITAAITSGRATSFSAYFTNADAVDLTFYDGLSVVGLASTTGTNIGSNELVSFMLNAGFTGVAIGSADLFTIDDLTLNIDPSSSAVPEPGSLLLCAGFIPLMALGLRARRSKSPLP